MSSHTLDHAANAPSANTSTISRRTIAKGVAWAVPAVLAAGAAPAFATSPVLFGEVNTACKYPGKSISEACKQDYRFETTWNNTSGAPLQVTFTVNVTQAHLQSVNGVLIGGTVYFPDAQGRVTVTVPAGETDIVIIANGDNSANIAGSYTITARYTHNGSDYTASATGDFDSTPPGGDCLTCPLG